MNFSDIRSATEQVLSGKVPASPSSIVAIPSVPSTPSVVHSVPKKPAMSNIGYIIFGSFSIVLLSLTVVYVIMRIRKQDQVIQQLKAESTQRLEDSDVRDLTRQFLSDPKNTPFLKSAIVPIMPWEQVIQTGLDRFKYQTEQKDEDEFEDEDEDDEEEPSPEALRAYEIAKEQARTLRATPTTSKVHEKEVVRTDYTEPASADEDTSQ
jgi:hypothetical protein